MKCTTCGCSQFILGTEERKFRVCLHCGAMERHRALWKILKDCASSTSKVLEISPLSPFIFGQLLAETYPGIHYVGVDKYVNGNPKDYRDCAFCDMFFDLVAMDLEIEPASFDRVIMQHVLEEILDYRKCIENISHVLVLGGVAFLEIPVHDGPEHIQQEANHYGNVWKFSLDRMIEDLSKHFTKVDVIRYSEGGFSGIFFVCHK